MKKIALYATGFVLMAVSLTSCEGLFETCKVCELVKYDDGVEIDRGTAIEYCGADLVAKEALGIYSIGGSLSAGYDCN
ncbi:MAG: hypothetical protein IH591_10410 [Bacteroidales bacterium]|nr:hypothetical protein [Bacteroidales bacterium]